MSQVSPGCDKNGALFNGGLLFPPTWTTVTFSRGALTPARQPATAPRSLHRC